MERPRPSTTRSQAAVYNKRMAGYKARLAAGKPERRVCDVDRKSGPAQRRIFGQPRLRHLGYALEQV